MKNRNAIQLLLAANAISGFSQGISMLAIPWYFARTHQAHTFNLAYALVTLIALVWGLYAGAIIDRFNRKHVFLLLNLVCGLLVGASAWFGYSQGSVNASIVLVFGVTMLNYHVHYPTLYALSQQLTEAHDYQKVNANIEVVGQTTSVLSGGLAALLLEGMNTSFDFTLAGLKLVIPVQVAQWPIEKIFAFDAITYLIACGLIAMMRFTSLHPAETEHGSVISRIRTGFAFLKQHRAVLLFGLFSYSVFAILIVEIHAVLPGYVTNHLQAPGYVFAIADTIYAIGAACAGLFVARLFSSAKTRNGVIVLTLLTAAIFYWCAASRSTLILYSVSLILGFTNAGIRVLRLTWLFHQVPNNLIGRVNSVFNLANMLTRSAFIFLFSALFFQQGSHITWAYVIMATFALISGLILLKSKPNTPLPEGK